MILHSRLNALAALALASLLAAMPATAAGTITMRIAGHALKAEVAVSDAERAKGLMFREKMGKDDGMVFVFDEPGYHSIWMRNTLIPLSVAFIDKGGTILNIIDMEPRTENLNTAAGPASYAIETNKGWFAEKKIKAGDKVTGLPKLP
jgi:uncharacterized membrane protein (UPF0127 family)